MAHGRSRFSTPRLARPVGWTGDGLTSLRLYLALALVTLIVFGVWPGLDLAVARLFYGAGGFVGRGAFAGFARDVFRVTPFVILVLDAALWAARRSGAHVRWAPSSRAMVFLIATMAVGPGLIVNLGLKDHWHRPRPVQTQEFNGPDRFMPWYDDGGACELNCSFVSGEASTGFWTAAPASVLPAPWRGPALVAAFVFGTAASLLRMAFGGHYLSDVLLGGLVTLIIIEIVRRLVWRTRLDRLRESSPPPREGKTAAEVAWDALAAPASNPRVARPGDASISPARRNSGS
jgi:lipid A 4'-phosphatase